jgi:hypothetical protein
MKVVKMIPEAEIRVHRDPWLDKVLDGTLRLLSETDWQARYKSPRSAASAIHQAAQKRGIKATVAIRGLDLYVQGQGKIVAAAEVKNTKSKAPRQAAAPAKKAPAKRVAAAKKAAPAAQVA